MLRGRVGLLAGGPGAESHVRGAQLLSFGAVNEGSKGDLKVGRRSSCGSTTHLLSSSRG